MKKFNASTIILALYVIIFALISLISYLNSKDFWIDGLTASLGCLLFLFLNFKYPVAPFIAILEGSIFIPNQLGFAFLYNMPSLDYHGDWIIHFFGSLVFVIVIMYYLQKITYIKEHVFLVALCSFAISMTGGILLEQAEYWGFIFFGLGNSYLGFGIGDGSANFGPWENSSLDVSFNFIGTVVGIACYYLYLYVHAKKSKSSHKHNF